MEAWLSTLIGVGGTLAAVGLTWFLTRRSEDKERAARAAEDANRQREDANRQREDANREREHYRIERRFERRLDAYSQFLSVVNRAMDRGLTEQRLGMPPIDRRSPEARWSWSPWGELSLINLLGGAEAVEAAKATAHRASLFLYSFNPDHAAEFFRALDVRDCCAARSRCRYRQCTRIPNTAAANRVGLERWPGHSGQSGNGCLPGDRSAVGTKITTRHRHR